MEWVFGGILGYDGEEFCAEVQEAWERDGVAETEGRGGVGQTACCFIFRVVSYQRWTQVLAAPHAFSR